MGKVDGDGDGLDEEDGGDVLMIDVTTMKKTTGKTIMRVMITTIRMTRAMTRKWKLIMMSMSMMMTMTAMMMIVLAMTIITMRW